MQINKRIYMSVPNYQLFMTPLLRELADGSVVSLKDIDSKVYNQLSLTPEQLQLRIPSGKQTYAYHRLGWAKTYLVQAGLIDQPKRAYCKITDIGTQALTSGEEIDNKYLSQFSDFIAFKMRSNKGETEVLQYNLANSSNEQTPQETLETAFETISSALAADILDTILKASPEFFENLVVDLMVAMGYGGSRKDAGQATQYSQDGGIDGIIKEDRLGLKMIYLQAKRYTNKTVGRPDLQAFAGALDMHRAKKGVFITTSSFSKEAIDFAGMIEKRIVLIDGERLTELMLEYNLGVSIKQVFEIKTIDTDYFTEE
jgi:restriction system protein